MQRGLEVSAAEVADALERASMLERSGNVTEAIRLLTSSNRHCVDPQLEYALVSLRHRAFASLEFPLPREPVPPIRATTPTNELAEHDAAGITAAMIRDGFSRQGCVLVRGLISRAHASRLADGIDRALDGFDAHAEGSSTDETLPWYAPFRPESGEYRVGGRNKWVRASGAVWTAESPRMLFELCELLDDTGVGALVTAHLGERPVLSANKCTLRRVPVDTNTNWHQDGAFLGADVGSVNLWLALSDCGSDSPGLEILPRRLDAVLPAGTDGAIFDWSVSPNIVADLAKDTPVITPEFRAGDALLFDHMFLHRTAVGPGMTRERYAMETWLFAPSRYPEGQIPIVY